MFKGRSKCLDSDLTLEWLDTRKESIPLLREGQGFCSDTAQQLSRAALDNQERSTRLDRLKRVIKHRDGRVLGLRSGSYARPIREGERASRSQKKARE